MPIKPIQNTDYEGEASLNFIEQYRNSDIQSLIKSAMGKVQELEESLYGFYTLLPLNTAIGETLDKWGEHFQVDRGGLTDTVFRDKILAQILSFTSSGRPEQLISIIELLTKAVSVRIIESTTEPRTVSFDINTDLATISVEELKNAITRALEATVKLSDTIIISPVNYFGFSNDPDSEGYATVADPNEGGFYSVVV